MKDRLNENSTSAEVYELVFAVVGAVGTDLEAFSRAFREYLSHFGYELIEHRLSQFLDSFTLNGQPLPQKPEFARISAYMTAGDQFRKKTQQDDVLALSAIAQISKERPKFEGKKMAYYLRSLKRPEEVDVLRRIYGPGFFLIGLYASEEERADSLHRDKRMTAIEAGELISRDAKEGIPHGQLTRETYQLADVFIRQGPQMKEQLWRFVDLVFGAPYRTPTIEENAMYMAYASSLRSGDLSRQVGAVLTNSKGDVLATGCNDVPKAFGGLYSGSTLEKPPPEEDCRDWVLEYESNEKVKTEIVRDLLDNTPLGAGLTGTPEEILEAGLSLLRGRKLFDITEYGRAVHAEMEALLCCSRNGVATRGCLLYTTTFPCHNCAKHLVAAGIEKVVYVEPYPKSLAKGLHFDAIAIDPTQEVDGKVRFEPFIGVGARRYVDLFSTGWSTGYPVKRKDAGKTVTWDRATAQPRVPMSPLSYSDREEVALDDLREALERL